MKTLAVLVVLTAAGWHTAMAQQGGDMGNQAVREAAAAAPAALQTLRALVNENNAPSYGFDSPREVATAALGAPISVSFVRLDELREYSENQDPAELMHALGQVLVPVTVGGQVRSTIVMERSGERWRAVSFGAPNLARLVSESRDAAARATNSSMDAMTLVHVAALGRYYVASRSEQQLMLTAVSDDPELNLKAGESRPASEVFARLAPIARSHNGLPM